MAGSLFRNGGRWFGCFAALCGAALLASRASATENAANAYPIGLNTLVMGIQPPPGDHLYNYSLYYDADQSNGPSGKSAVPRFNAQSEVSAFRWIHTWTGTIAGLHPSLDVALPIAHIDVLSPAGRHETTAISDLNVGLILARHRSNFHDYFEVKAFVPTGSYDKDRLVNAGRGYTSLALFYGATYFPTKNLDIGALVAYTWNFENTHTDYKSGEEATLEFSSNYRISKSFYVGLGGYYYKQTSDDRLNGAIAPRNGYRGMAFAAGPQLRASLGKVGFGLKWQHEFRAENRPQGERLWLQVYLPLTPGARVKASTLSPPEPTR